MGGFGETGTVEEVRSIWTRALAEVTRVTGLERFDAGVNVALDMTDWHQVGGAGGGSGEARARQTTGPRGHGLFGPTDHTPGARLPPPTTPHIRW